MSFAETGEQTTLVRRRQTCSVHTIVAQHRAGHKNEIQPGGLLRCVVLDMMLGFDALQVVYIYLNQVSSSTFSIPELPYLPLTLS